jgi:hypothetical protein
MMLYLPKDNACSDAQNDSTELQVGRPEGKGGAYRLQGKLDE